jgi:hypothetical protein
VTYTFHHVDELWKFVQARYAEECDRRRLFSDRPGRLVSNVLSLQLYQAKKSRFRHVGCNLLPRCNLMSTLGVCAVQGGCVGRTVLATKLQWDGGAWGFSEQRITGDCHTGDGGIVGDR